MSKQDKQYNKTMEALQIELAGLHRWLKRSGKRLVVVF